MMSPKLLSIYNLLLLIALSSACGSNSDTETGPPEPVVAVQVTKAVRGDIATTIRVTGTISPVQETFIGPKVSGRIEKLFAEEGTFVSRGSPLVQLEQVRFDLALSEAQASLEESRANLKNIKLKLKRQQELYATGVVDQQLFDDTKTQQELAQARLHMARARFKRADEDKKDSVLYAPFSGFVVERRMNSGELFSGMANEYVFHLIDTRTVEVESNIIETKKRYLKQQQAVTVTVDAIPDKSFAGTITAINPLVDPASRKFLVKITVKNPSFELESGMFARVGIPEKSSLQAILVPAGAVIERHGKTVLFTTENNRAVTKEVKIGLVTHELLEVIDSISEGTPVITDGLYAVKDGTPIKVISRQ